MEPIIIGTICLAVFGAVAALSAFIRQLLLSRDKRLNDLAQTRALDQEARELEKLRLQMDQRVRLDCHYKALGTNKTAIENVDKQIEIMLSKKLEIIERYAKAAKGVSSAIVGGAVDPDRKAECDLLKEEIDKHISAYNLELEKLQTRRASLWDASTGLQDHMIKQEQLHNDKLNELYIRHTEMLDKVYLRNSESAERAAKDTVEAGTHTYRDLFLAPIQFILGFFKMASGILSGKADEEKAARNKVSQIEKEISGDREVAFKPRPLETMQGSSAK